MGTTICTQLILSYFKIRVGTHTNLWIHLPKIKLYFSYPKSTFWDHVFLCTYISDRISLSYYLTPRKRASWFLYSFCSLLSQRGFLSKNSRKYLLSYLFCCGTFYTTDAVSRLKYWPTRSRGSATTKLLWNHIRGLVKYFKLCMNSCNLYYLYIKR